jgi:hypothetical protein
MYSRNALRLATKNILGINQPFEVELNKIKSNLSHI